MNKNDLKPGSHEAIKQGCTCPRMGNRYGKGMYINKKSESLFVYNLECPIHGEYKND